MNIDLKPSDFRSMEDYMRTVLTRTRNLANKEWKDFRTDRMERILKQIAAMSRKALESKLVGLLTRPTPTRARISEEMRAEIRKLRKKGMPVPEIADKVGVSMPAVYKISA